MSKTPYSPVGQWLILFLIISGLLMGFSWIMDGPLAHLFVWLQERFGPPFWIE